MASISIGVQSRNVCSLGSGTIPFGFSVLRPPLVWRGPLVALQERGLGPGDDAVLHRRRVLLRRVGGARERLRQLALDALVDALARGGDRRARVPRGQEGAYDRLKDRAAEVRCKSAVPEAIPTRFTGTEPVSECEAGVPASPTPMPMKA